MQKILIFPQSKKWIVSLALLVFVALGAYLRLWHITHLVNAFHDYEPAVYMLDARSITQGFLPYRDFVLVHPPLYEYVLAAAIKIFGYSFFLGKYVSVFFSVASIILIFFVGKKASHPVAGLVAAALFAVSPDMVYYGSRAVQESLCIFLVLVSILCATDYIRRQRLWALVVSGVACGLAVATKYTFFPAFFAILGAVLLLKAGRQPWQWLRKFAQLSFIVIFLSLAAAMVGLLFILNRGMDLPVPVPFFTSTYESVNLLVGISVTFISFMLSFLLAIRITEKKFPLRNIIKWLCQVVIQKEIWVMGAGALLGFMVIIGFFLLKVPSQYIEQTITIQNRYLLPAVPTMVLLSEKAFSSTDFVGISYLPVLLAIPLAIVLLVKGRHRGTYFFACAILAGMLFSMEELPAPRYYVSVYPFLLLGLGSLLPSRLNFATANLSALEPFFRAITFSIIGTFILFICITSVLLNNYTGYDIASDIPAYGKNTEYVYEKTANFLESVSANKVWSPNPVYAAILSPQIPSTINIDTTAIVWLQKNPPEQLVYDKMAEGVDYVILDCWIRTITFGPNVGIAKQLSDAIQNHGHLVAVIGPEYPVWTEIWKLDDQ